MLCTMSNIFLNVHLQGKCVINALCLLCKEIAFVGVFFPFSVVFLVVFWGFFFSSVKLSIYYLFLYN